MSTDWPQPWSLLHLPLFVTHETGSGNMTYPGLFKMITWPLTHALRDSVIIPNLDGTWPFKHNTNQLLQNGIVRRARRWTSCWRFSSEDLLCFFSCLLTGRSDWDETSEWCRVAVFSERFIQSGVVTWIDTFPLNQSNLSPIWLDALIRRVCYTLHRRKKNQFYLINSRCSYDRKEIKSTIRHSRDWI